MRRRFGQVLRLGVSPAGVALLTASRFGGAGALLDQCALDPAAPLEAIGPALRQLFASGDLRGWPVAVVVADELARLWAVAPPAGATRVADLEAAAALRFHALYGDGPANWAISAAWDPRRPFLAAALPRSLVGILTQACGDGGMHLVQLVPHFVAAWNRWQGALRPGAWFGVLHEDVLTVAVTAGRRPLAVRSLALGAGTDLAQLAVRLAREALLLGVAAPAALTVCGPAPATWNRQDGALACTVLGAPEAGTPPAVQLALAGAAA